KMRVHIETEAGGMKLSFVRVTNGDKFWSKMGDNTTEVTAKEEIEEVKENGHAGWVTDLVPLKDKGFERASLGEVIVGDKKAAGVRVSHKGHRDVDLYFDKATGLLVKSEYTVKDDQSGRELRQETFYSDHKEVSGLKVPMKVAIHRDGKIYVDVEISEIELKDKLDDAVFGKP